MMSPDLIARAFTELSSEQQAEFFTKAAQIMRGEWSHIDCVMQLASIRRHMEGVRHADGRGMLGELIEEDAWENQPQVEPELPSMSVAARGAVDLHKLDEPTYPFSLRITDTRVVAIHQLTYSEREQLVTDTVFKEHIWALPTEVAVEKAVRERLFGKVYYAEKLCPECKGTREVQLFNSTQSCGSCR
jgi:hypothetical protein